MQKGNVWSDQAKLLLVQAPMEDVTDTVFRQMLAYVGKPDIFFTEFTNVDGVFSDGKSSVIHRLKYNPAVERPIIAQIWGHDPENYYNGAKYVKKLGFDGVDINMGCPQRKVVSKGLCAALIDNHEHAAKVIQATIDGAEGMPVSVKTRIGVKNIDTENWVNFLLNFDIQAITIHGRTVKEKSRVPCHWDEIGKAVHVRNKKGSHILILGNGDVKSHSEALQKAEKYGVDGIMIARAMTEDIQVFVPDSEKKPLSIQDRLKLFKKHMDLFEETWVDTSEYEKRAYVIKKYVSNYISGFDGARKLRAQIMESNDLDEMRNMLDTFSG